MNSKTHSAVAWPQWLRSLTRPLSEMVTISPGSTSRRNLAPMASRAQLSLATTQPPSISPMHSGRKPMGSRTAMSLLGDMMTSEYAPFKWFIARLTASSMEPQAMRSRVMA